MPPVDWLRAVGRLLLELVAPSLCAACGVELHVAAAFCAGCAASVEESSDAEAVFEYGGAIAHAIARLKYGGRLDVARPLGALFAARGAGRVPAVDGVLPVPLHRDKLVRRGFNQAALLARPLALALRVPCEPGLLVRRRSTTSQATLSRSARLSNLAGAFAVERPSRVAGRHVLLVDDVRTTGATLHACSEALLGAGARSVARLTLARAAPFAASEPRRA